MLCLLFAHGNFPVVSLVNNAELIIFGGQGSKLRFQAVSWDYWHLLQPEQQCCDKSNHSSALRA